MRIICKSCATHEQLTLKNGIIRYIEIQLFDDFIKGQTPRDMFRTIVSNTALDILVVHSPIIQNDDVDLEYCEDPFCREQLALTFELADMLAEYYKHPVSVVIHSGFSLKQYQKFPILLDAIKKLFSEYLDRGDNISICIENVISYVIHDGIPSSRNGWSPYDTPDVVRYLRRELHTDRICSVLDTCHLMVSLKTVETVFRTDYPQFIQSISMEDYFRQNSDVLGLIHLSDVEKLGYDKGTHGILFVPSRISVMRDIVELYAKYNCSCDITLEIQEQDYALSPNFQQNRSELAQILDSLTIHYF